MKFKRRLRWLTDTFVDLELKSQYNVPGARRQSSLMAIAIGSFAAVGGFIYGYDTGLSNNVLSMDYVVENFSENGKYFSSKERALATASLSLGTLFGSIVSPLLSDVFGRKMAILFAALVVFNIGNVVQIASTGENLLCVGRSITGTAIGVISAVVPLYQSEASPKWIRGAIVSTYQWAITWGFLCSSAISQGTYHINNTSSYRIPIGLQSCWALILSAGLWFLLPESPRFYVMKDRIPEAAQSLCVLRRVPVDDPGLIEELVDIKATHDYTASLSSYSYLDCFKSGKGKNKLGLRMTTGIFLQALQQATGINFIFYYGVWFFVTTGVVKQSFLYSFLTYAVNVIGTIPGILLIEIIGRRKSLIYGGIGMSVSTFIVAIMGTVKVDGEVTSKIMLAFVCLFIFFFASTWGPGVWVITSEIFPLSVRGRAVSLSTATNWLFNFGFAFLSPYLIGSDKNSTMTHGVKIFYLWGGLNLFATIFSYFTVYETRGLKLEEIDEMYRCCKNARDSTNFVSRGLSRIDDDHEKSNIIRESIINNYNSKNKGKDNKDDDDSTNDQGSNDASNSHGTFVSKNSFDSKNFAPEDGVITVRSQSNKAASSSNEASTTKNNTVETSGTLVSYTTNIYTSANNSSSDIGIDISEINNLDYNNGNRGNHHNNATCPNNAAKLANLGSNGTTINRDGSRTGNTLAINDNDTDNENTNDNNNNDKDDNSEGQDAEERNNDNVVTLNSNVHRNTVDYNMLLSSVTQTRSISSLSTNSTGAFNVDLDELNLYHP